MSITLLILFREIGGEFPASIEDFQLSSSSSPSHPLVGVIMGSLSDYEIIQPALDLMERWGVPYEVIVASAHRTPERASAWATGAEGRGMEVIIAAAGGAAHLPGVIAAQTTLPVIGMPVESGALQGVDALYAIVQMPPGIPVATVGINGAVNAAMLALHILARIDSRWLAVLKAERAGMAEKVDRQQEQLRERRPRSAWSPASSAPQGSPAQSETTGEVAPDTAVRSADLERPLRPAPGAKSILGGADEVRAASSAQEAPLTPRGSRGRRMSRVSVDSDLLPMDVAERAVGCLLEGGIIALPTDTVYGLVADATNPGAVGRLYEIKGRDPGRAIAIFIDSQRSLASLVHNLTVDVRRMLEAFWPGPLTVVFDRRGGEFDHLSPGSTVGVRLPDNSIPLTLIQELRRPIACTSANISGEASPTSADQVEQSFGDRIDMILDAGSLPERATSTVIDVTQTPFRILREGAVSRSQLTAVVGELLSDE